MTAIQLRAAGATDVGRVRSVNEDRLLIADRLFAVADGMGGHAAGEVAAQVAVDTLHVAAGATTDELVEAVKVANEAVIQRSARDPSTRGMGTTLCAVALVDTEPVAEGGDTQQVAVVNVGDSRVYLYQGGDLIQVTEDHSLVEDMVREGNLTPEQARNHPSRNIVTRSLGNESDIDVDVWEVSVREGDRFLLTSDGLFNEVDDDRIAAVLRRLGEPEEAAQELVRLANEAGGRDNITVVVVDVVDDAGRTEADAAATGTGTGRAGATSVAGDGPRDRARRRGTDEDELGAPRAHRVTWRTAVFTVLVVAIVGGAFFVVDWYGGSGWYVGIDDERVAIFKGRPGGVLWVDPEVDEHTDLREQEVPPARLADLRSGKEVASRAAALRFVANLEEEAERLGTATTTTTTTTTLPPTGTATSTTTTAGA